MKRKLLFLALFLTAGFFTTNRAEDCTLNVQGTCKCVALVDSEGTIIGYSCRTGSSEILKCVCPPPPED